MTFEDRVNQAYHETGTVLSLGLDPQPGIIPPRSSIEDWATKLIEATYEFVPFYKANLSGYLKFGDYPTLAKAYKLAQDHGRLFTIDPKVSELEHTAAVYARKYLLEINADAAIVNPFPFLDDTVRQFLPYLEEKGIFVLNYTTSRNSEIFWNNFKFNEKPAWKYISLKVANDWSKKPTKQDYSPVGIVAGPRNISIASEIRDICNAQIVLIPGIGIQKVPLEVLRKFRRTDTYFPGIIAHVGRDIIEEWKKYPDEEPYEVMKRKAKTWSQKLNEVLM